MKRIKIASTGPSKNFLSQIETPCVGSYMAYAIQELVPTWLRVPIWSGTLLFGHLWSMAMFYNYLIETFGTFTREKLKAYKSLEACNYYHSGHVQTAYYHSIDSNLCILKEK